MWKRKEKSIQSTPHAKTTRKEILNCCRKAGSKVSKGRDHNYCWEAAVPRLLRGQGEHYEILTSTLSSRCVGRRKEQAGVNSSSPTHWN